MWTQRKSRDNLKFDRSCESWYHKNMKMKDVLGFKPFSEMRDIPPLTYTEVVSSLRIDPDDRLINVAQGCRPETVRQSKGVPLRYTAKQSADYKRAATHCEACGKEFLSGMRKCGDHNHSTGEWRGVLCVLCNIRAGWLDKLREDPCYVEKLVRYLSK
jgi:Recombination endonuclease VII